MTDKELKDFVERVERSERNCREMMLRMSAMVSSRITGSPFGECLEELQNGKSKGFFPEMFDGLEEK